MLIWSMQLVPIEHTLNIGGIVRMRTSPSRTPFATNSIPRTPAVVWRKVSFPAQLKMHPVRSSYEAGRQSSLAYDPRFPGLRCISDTAGHDRYCLQQCYCLTCERTLVVPYLNDMLLRESHQSALLAYRTRERGKRSVTRSSISICVT